MEREKGREEGREDGEGGRRERRTVRDERGRTEREGGGKGR